MRARTFIFGVVQQPSVILLVQPRLLEGLPLLLRQLLLAELSQKLLLLARLGLGLLFRFGMRMVRRGAKRRLKVSHLKMTMMSP